MIEYVMFYLWRDLLLIRGRDPKVNVGIHIEE